MKKSIFAIICVYLACCSGVLAGNVVTRFASTAPPAVVTLGHDPAVTPTSTGTSPSSFARFVAPAGGSFTARSIRAYFTQSGRSWIGGVYADSAGSPAARIVVSATGTTVANVYNCSNLVSPVSIVAETAYFEGWLVDSGLSIGYGYSAGTNARWTTADTYSALSDPFNGSNTGSPRMLGTYLSSDLCP